jgi:hypothetical protein
MLPIHPILPSNAVQQAKANKVFPDVVIEVFNEFIVKNMQGRRSKVYQNEVIQLIIDKTEGLFGRQEIFAEKWLDVEDHFRNFGWKVTYDKPAYCESGEPYFIFEA